MRADEFGGLLGSLPPCALGKPSGDILSRLDVGGNLKQINAWFISDTKERQKRDERRRDESQKSEKPLPSVAAEIAVRMILVPVLCFRFVTTAYVGR